jgi:uncharacterized membrane protein YgcG
MIERLQAIFIVLNFFPLGIFWSLYALKASPRRPFHLSWFGKGLFITHLLSVSFLFLWIFQPNFHLVVFNALVILFVLRSLKRPCSVLISDLQYGFIVGGILLRKKGLMLSPWGIIPYETPRRSWDSGGSSSSDWSSDSSSSSSSSSSSGGGSFGGGGSSGSW